MVLSCSGQHAEFDAGVTYAPAYHFRIHTDVVVGIEKGTAREALAISYQVYLVQRRHILEKQTRVVNVSRIQIHGDFSGVAHDLVLSQGKVKRFGGNEEGVVPENADFCRILIGS